MNSYYQRFMLNNKQSKTGLGFEQPGLGSHLSGGGLSVQNNNSNNYYG
jgi:hypothetical protein